MLILRVLWKSSNYERKWPISPIWLQHSLPPTHLQPVVVAQTLADSVVVPHPRTPFSLLTPSVGIMPSLGKQLRSVKNHATGETPRPDPGLIPTSRLFYVTDTHTDTRFLVDTGSEVSVILLTLSKRKSPPDKLTLIAVNSTPITTYGKQSLTLNLGLRRSFAWIFIIADVQRPILGADFLQHFGLSVDMKHRRLSDAVTNQRIQGILFSDSSPSPSIVPKTQNDPYLQLLAEFPALTQVCTLNTPVKHKNYSPY